MRNFFLVVGISLVLMSVMLLKKHEYKLPVHGAGAAQTPNYTSEQLASMREEVNKLPTDEGDRSISSWQCIGPFGADLKNDTFNHDGRIRVLAWANNAASNDLGIRMGSASGGVWRMVRNPLLPLGIHEPEAISNTTASSDLNCAFVGGLAVHPTDRNIMICGTGEPTQSTGSGIWRTTNGGASWSKIPDVTSASFYKILFNEFNPRYILACANDGICVSTDTGKTFTKFNTGEPIYDAAVSPQNPDTYFYTQSDGWIVGRSFTSGVAPAARKVVPIGITASRMNICFSKTDYSIWFANVVYDTIVNSLTIRPTRGIYASKDTGKTWTRCSHRNEAGLFNFDFHYGQGHYNNCISMHPSNPNIVLAGGARVMRRLPGDTFVEVVQHGHVDVHDFLWTPNGSRVYVATDGGLFYSEDNGTNWTSRLNGIGITQFYDIEVSKKNPNMILGATQDNGVINTYYANNTTYWEANIGGDGGYVAIDHNDPTHAVCQTHSGMVRQGSLYETVDGGYTWTSMPNTQNMYLPRWPRVATGNNNPLNNSPFAAQGNKLLRKMGLTNNWTEVNANYPFDANINHLALGNTPNPQSEHNIYVSLDNGKVWVYDRNTSDWRQSSYMFPSGQDVRLFTHYSEPDVVYAVITGWVASTRILKSTDAGQSWVGIQGNMPFLGLNCVLEHPYDPNQLFVGTRNFGVLKSNDGGQTWIRWENGMTKSMDVTSLDFIDSTSINGKLYIVAGTYGRSIWKREASSEEPSAIRPKEKVIGVKVIHKVMLGELQLELENAIPGTYTTTIYNMNGQTVAQQRQMYAPGEQIKIPLRTLSAGQYVYAIRGNGMAIRSERFYYMP